MMRPTRWEADVVIFSRLAVTLAATAVVTAPAPFDLPPPTGQFAVGTTSWHVSDPSRSETFAEPPVAREVEVLAWYPASPSGRAAAAPYLRAGLPEVQAFASVIRAPSNAYDTLAAVQTHARLDAPPDGSTKRPVLVFSHGYGSLATASTSLLEDLASRGFIVLSIVHPYESAAATLESGRVVTFLNEAGKLRQGYLDVLNEWAHEDEIMASVTQAAAEDDQRRLLRGYISAIPKTTEALRRWVDDTRLVLNRWPALPTSSIGRQLAERADADRLGVFGHSMGGVTAGSSASKIAAAERAPTWTASRSRAR